MLDMQSLLSINNYDFAGGATGTYRSTDEALTYSFSNSGNDDVGPTRGFTYDGTYVYTRTSQGLYSIDNYLTYKLFSFVDLPLTLIWECLKKTPLGIIYF
jgi:hypothetical protein